MFSCPHCQTPHPTHQLTCRRCGQYMDAQGAVEYVRNPTMMVVAIVAALGIMGFGGWYYMKAQQAKQEQAQASGKMQTAEVPQQAPPAPAQKKSKKKKRRR